ncbi:ABC transporter ATP-binding protein [Martelella sp. HB161492]|uniref:ABC transporter ATP-binding protein n=1 Tax=Martelella sp. HB161492 TaxID=2720726 RepID=UPI001590219E|nr:ABC transporter ATP-binding protein [Martelella sp. HB161492]
MPRTATPQSLSPSPAKLAIEISDLSVSFGEKEKTVRAIDRISLDIREGEFLTLIGHSGCGKSTLLRAIADIIQPSEGRVRVLGDHPSVARKARDFSMVFQQPALMPWATVLENVTLPFRVGGGRNAGRHAMEPMEALRLVELEAFRDARPAELSGGMRQRVSIARALVTRPRILLMDEPFSALDELVRDMLNIELRKIWKQSGVTIVFVTHSLQEAAFLSERVVAMGRRPSRIAGIVDIDLGAERDLKLKDEPALVGYVARLRALLDEG